MKKKALAKYWGFSHGKRCIGKHAMKPHSPNYVLEKDYMLRQKPYTGEELTNEDLTKVSLYFDALNKEAA